MPPGADHFSYAGSQSSGHAFLPSPGAPTELAGQRYNSMGIEDSDRLFAFLQATGVNSNIRVRVRHGFARSTPKGTIGIHQGGTLSPGKYSLSLDPPRQTKLPASLNLSEKRAQVQLVE